MDKSKKTIWDFFISHRQFSTLLLILVFILGIIAVAKIPKESDPEVDIPVVVVSTVLPGASAQEMEELVTDKLEDKLIGLDGARKINSTSKESFSTITIEFEAGKDSEDQKTKVQDKVDLAKVDLPDQAEDPVVFKIESSDQPIYIFSLSGPYEVVELNRLAEKLKDDLEKISKVSEVSIVGGKEREIKILVDKAALDRFGLSLSQVTRSISQANANIPTGSIKTAGSDYLIKLSGELKSADEVAEVPIVSIKGSVVKVSDIAEVIDGYKDEKTKSRLSLEGQPSLPAVSINIFKSRGGNIIRTVDKVEELIAKSKKDFLPQDISTEVFLNMADFIKEDLNNLIKSGIQTIILVFILLYIFVGGREAILASLAVPLSFLMAFIFLAELGFTLNFLSLFSLILALGILIDTAIVVVERMNIYINDQELSPKEAALLTVKEFQYPLITGTLTTVFAFVPMLLMSGIMGQYMRVIPITVSLVLLSSLFVGLGFIPSLASRRKSKLGRLSLFFKSIFSSWVRFFSKIRVFIGDRIFNSLSSKYRRGLNNLLFLKSRRRIFWLVIWILFIISLSLPISGAIKVKLFMQEDGDFFAVKIKKSARTLLEDTSKTMEEVEKKLLTDEVIKSFSISVGQASFSGGSGENIAEAVINLKKDREVSSIQISEYYQKYLEKMIDDAEISIIQMGSGPPSSAPVDIGLRGDNIKDLEVQVLKLKDILSSIPGAINVQTSIDEPRGEFLLDIDRNKAKAYGISTIELASLLRNAVHGAEATTIREKGEEVEVIVKYDLEIGRESVSINDLESLTIATPAGDIPLGALVKTNLSSTQPTIRHEEGKRALRLTADNESEVSPVEIVRDFQKKIEGVDLPQDIEIVFGGEQEDIDQSFADMFKAMILAIFLIAGILVLQFASYRQPLFILSTIPFSFIGIFPGLVLIGSPLTLPAIIGVVALAGIVVNNGIILIDTINSNRRLGKSKEEAILEAGTSRLRPIILTTLTTLVGIMPITLASAVWGSLGFTIIFGLAASSVLTLFAVPLLYRRFGEKELRED